MYHEEENKNTNNCQSYKSLRYILIEHFIFKDQAEQKERRYNIYYK